MTQGKRQIAAVAAVLALSTLGGSTMTSAAENGPVACRIKVTQLADGMVQLEGEVTAKEAVKGSYQMRISQKSNGGVSETDQGGEFSADPGKPSVLNQAAFSGDGVEFDAELTVTWPGGSLTCVESSLKQL
jgi:hypothetical protein